MHCGRPSLRLEIYDACKIFGIRNCVENVPSVCTFFELEFKKIYIEAQTRLSSIINMTIVEMCETRWVLRQDCIKRFKEMFILIN